MNVFIFLLIFFAAWACLFAIGGLVMLAADLRGWTHFWIAGPYNARRNPKR